MDGNGEYDPEIGVEADDEESDESPPDYTPEIDPDKEAQLPSDTASYDEARKEQLAGERETELEADLELDMQRFKRRYGPKKRKLPPELTRLARSSEAAALERLECAARSEEATHLPFRAGSKRVYTARRGFFMNKDAAPLPQTTFARRFPSFRRPTPKAERP